MEVELKLNWSTKNINNAPFPLEKSGGGAPFPLPLPRPTTPEQDFTPEFMCYSL